MPTEKTVFKNAREPPSRARTEATDTWERKKFPRDLSALPNHKAAWRGLWCSLIIQAKMRTHSGWSDLKGKISLEMEDQNEGMLGSITYPSSNRDFPFLGGRQEGTPPLWTQIRTWLLLVSRMELPKSSVWGTQEEGISWWGTGSLHCKWLSFLSMQG